MHACEKLKQSDDDLDLSNNLNRELLAQTYSGVTFGGSKESSQFKSEESKYERQAAKCWASIASKSSLKMSSQIFCKILHLRKSKQKFQK